MLFLAHRDTLQWHNIVFGEAGVPNIMRKQNSCVYVSNEKEKATWRKVYQGLWRRLQLQYLVVACFGNICPGVRCSVKGTRKDFAAPSVLHCLFAPRAATTSFVASRVVTCGKREIYNRLRSVTSLLHKTMCTARTCRSLVMRFHRNLIGRPW